MSGELPVNLTGLSINRAWSVVYNQTNDDERAFAAAFLKHHNAVLYLNGLYSDPQINRYKREARRLLIDAAGENGVIVDVGCGSGEELRLLALELGSFNVELIGVDPSAQFVEATRKACQDFKNVSVIQGGGEQLSSLVTTEVDAIRVERVLQHIDSAVIKKILEQIRLTLKLGGILVVTEPVWTDRHVDLGLADELENTRVHDAVLAQAYKTCRNPKLGRELVKYCRDAGFDIVSVATHTSCQRTVAEFDRTTSLIHYTQIPQMVESMREAEKAGTLCVLFPFVTVVAKKK